MSGLLRVLIADDHVPTRDDLERTLDDDGRFAVCGQAGDAAATVRLAVQERPDVCLIDVRMPGNGIAAAWEISARLPETRIVMLTVSSDDDDLLEALRSGACSYLLKDMDLTQLPDTLAEVVEGNAAIPRQLVARLIDEFRGGDPRRRSLLAGGGRGRLTSREWQVLELLNGGMTTAGIAGRLFVSQTTVRSHIARILKKLGAHDRAEALELFRVG